MAGRMQVVLVVVRGAAVLVMYVWPVSDLSPTRTPPCPSPIRLWRTREGTQF